MLNALTGFDSSLYMDMIFQWMQNISPVYIYIFLAIDVFFENVFPPVPSDIFIIFTGFLASHGIISMFSSLVALLIGNITGALVMYFSGAKLLKWLKEREMHTKNRIILSLLKFTSLDDMEKAGIWFRNYGLAFVLLSRFIPGIRFFVSIIAGASHFPPVRFMLAYTIGVTIWNYLLLKGGYMLGDNWKYIVELLSIYSRLVGYVTVVGILLVVGYFILKRKKNTTTDI
jgi:membrane protein DedA with SNARE-associated domain